MIQNHNCSQPQICQEKWNSVEDKFKVIHHRLDDVESDHNRLNSKIDDLSIMKEVLVELKLLTAQQVKDNKKRDTVLEKHSETLVQMNINLTNMNSQFEESEKNILDLRKGLKIVEENIYGLSADNSIKISDIIKYAITVCISIIIGILLNGAIGLVG